jgi:hypothetical protein
MTMTMLPQQRLAAIRIANTAVVEILRAANGAVLRMTTLPYIQAMGKSVSNEVTADG